MASLVSFGLVDHGFIADSDTDPDYTSGSSDLVGEQAMDVDREALEVRVMDDIPEAAHDTGWS